MTIKNIYGPPGVAPPTAAKGAQKVKAARVDQAAPSDRVEFSSVLQQINRPGEVSGTAAAQRAQKVAELKAQVASGNYQPDLTKVAASLLQFMTEEK